MSRFRYAVIQDPNIMAGASRSRGYENGKIPLSRPRQSGVAHARDSVRALVVVVISSGGRRLAAEWWKMLGAREGHLRGSEGLALDS